MKTYHTPVLIKESIEALSIKDNGVYVDLTLGGGGHTEAILQANKSVKVYSFDQDQDAIDFSSKRLEKYSDRLTIIKDNFQNIITGLALERINKIDGVLMDLGVSSFQINSANRGFSFSVESPLDMRMDQSTEISAATIVNEYSQDEIRQIIWEYGEEREASRIARAICIARKEKELSNTIELSNIIDKAVRSRMKLKAKARVFQAFRIHINGEMDVLNSALNDIVPLLKIGGRIVVISYHSIEDRIVKKFFQYQEKSCVCPPQFLKCICNKVALLKIKTRKPILPTAEEIQENSRSRSAKLRFAEKI